MDPSWLSVAPMLLGGVMMVVAQAGAVRLMKGLPLLNSWLLGVLVGLCSALAVTGWICARLSRGLHDSMLALVSNAVVFICVGYGYFHFVNLGETARRVRILWELYESSDGLTYEEILTRYGASEIINRRIDRLTNAGQITQQGGRIYSKGASVLVMARILSLLKRVFLGRREVDVRAYWQ